MLDGVCNSSFTHEILWNTELFSGMIDQLGLKESCIYIYLQRILLQRITHVSLKN